MALPKKRQQVLAAICKDAGLTVLSIGLTKGSHAVMTLRTDTGKEFRAVASATPSCPRSDLNFRATMRRLARQ